MPKVSASVLIVGHPQPESVKFGAEFVKTLQDYSPETDAQKFAVTVISITPQDHLLGEEILKKTGLEHPLGQRIIIHHGSRGETLKRYIDQASIFKFLPSFEDPLFERTVQEALEEFDLLQQNEELMNLVREQNETLKRLRMELEERVQKRQKSLMEAEKRLKANHQKTMLLHSALVAIHSSSSLTLMEHQITTALAPQMQLAWTRILFPMLPTPSFIDEDKTIQTLLLPLFEGTKEVGQICYARSWEKPFNKEETAFLTLVTEAVALATRRLYQLGQSENLKSQWEATFDAISSPLSVVDANYNIRRANKAYAERCERSYDQVIGQKCYQMLFRRSSPCPGCRLGKSFRWTDAEGKSSQVFEVHSQKLADPEDPTYLQIYADVSEKLRLERQILESSKMAELGTIGSSIAHELNNPLGGVLNFIQLIKMDMTPSSPHWEDVSEMESAAQKCKAIIENLLGFSRQPHLHELRPVLLKEVLLQAVQIVELKSRSLGVHIAIQSPDEAYFVEGRFNLLSQGVHNLLQNAFEAIALRMKEERGLKGQIQIALDSSRPGWVTLTICDNGIGFSGTGEMSFAPLYSTKDPEKHSGLGLSVARQIFQEHGGDVTLERHSGTTVATLTLPLAPAPATA